MPDLREGGPPSFARRWYISGSQTDVLEPWGAVLNAILHDRRAEFAVSAGIADAAPLSAKSIEGPMPRARELNIVMLIGTILTGLTGVLLMAAALYVSFHGRNTFSTPYNALKIVRSRGGTGASSQEKTDRARPVSHPHSDVEVIQASVRQNDGDVSRIHTQSFKRIKVSLATVGTSLSKDIPPYKPMDLLAADQPLSGGKTAHAVNPDIYGTKVEGDVDVRNVALPLKTKPAPHITDAMARDFVLNTMGEGFMDGPAASGPALAYAPVQNNVTVLHPKIAHLIEGGLENVTVVPETSATRDKRLGQTEHVVTIKQNTPLAEALKANGFTDAMIKAIKRTVHNVYSDTILPPGAHLRILYGQSSSDTVVPYRFSIYLGDTHVVTVALTDQGRYVLALAPPPIKFSDKDVEQINVNTLPSLYRSIWETARKHKLPDAMIRRIIAMFAYDTDLTKKVSPSDSINILETDPQKGKPQLLYVSLNVDNTSYQMFRFRTDDGVVDYYDSDGRTGKRFLVRRPLDGGGRETSPFGWRMHPVFHRRIFHTGVDLAAPRGTPIYAAGDGVVVRDNWVSGYGRLVEIKHANGYSTRYAHMHRFAKGLHPGEHVRQGQVIGYVGATGDATGPHLHFEIRINGHPQNPLSVRLPRAKALPPRYESAFNQMVHQIEKLMDRKSNDTQIASAA